MAALKDHLAVVLMLLGEIWPWALVAILVPAGLALWRMRHGGWSDARSGRAALLGFFLGAIGGTFAAFALVGGAPADLGYWLDWAFLLVLAAVAGAYGALLAYLAMPPAGPQRG